MYNLALVGKNIAHSRSPEIYNKLLDGKVSYHLLDFPSENEIPKADELLKIYDGISITSPYKKFFIDQVKLIGPSQELKAINCIRKNNSVLEGANTDLLAIEEILKNYHDKFESVILLGDGVMSSVTQFVLKKLSLRFLVLSRRLNKNFDQLNLSEYVGKKNVLVINTCARQYVYQGDVVENILFWDFNYNFDAHRLKFNSKCMYMDGLEMLELQAKYAIAFWSNEKLS